MSDSLRPRGLQHARLSCTLSTPVHLLKHMSITSVMPVNHLIFCCPLLLCLQSLPASESFPVSQLIASGGQNIGASGSASVLPMNIQGWFHEFTLRNLICQWMIYLWKCHFLKIFFGGEAVTDKEETIKGFNDWVTWLGWCFRGIAQTRLNECEW